MFPRSLGFLALALVALATTTLAGGTVHVRAYTRRDGTHVAAHDRRAPGAGSATAPAPSTRYTQPLTRYDAPLTLTASGELPHVPEHWSPGKIVSGKYIPGHYAKTTLRAAATQFASSFSQSLSITTPITIERDANGKIKRNESAKRAFMRATGYPNGRPGYVVDHIIPLKRGGADDPSNMQWQTVEEAKAKDKSE